MARASSLALCVAERGDFWGVVPPPLPLGKGFLPRLEPVREPLSGLVASLPRPLGLPETGVPFPACWPPTRPEAPGPVLQDPAQCLPWRSCWENVKLN